MLDVTVIGMGGMGKALALSLLAAGHKVTVWNRTVEKAQPVVDAGASLASSGSAAVKASPVIISCVNSHGQTETILSEDPKLLAGKKIIDLSTGNSGEAESLEKFIQQNDAECLIGMIFAYPSGIGQEDTKIVTAGSEAVWNECQSIIKIMGPASTYIGTHSASIAALFSAIFLPRQGFMFGMIYGALLCEKANVPTEDYFKELPATLKSTLDYINTASTSIPCDEYADNGASINVYRAAFDEMLATFRQNNTSAVLPDLMSDLIDRGVEAGFGNQQLTALIKLLR